jgi:hypothetical protein
MDSLALECEVLRQRVAELEDIISGDVNAYLSLGITVRDATIVGALMRRDVLTIDHMRTLLSDDEGYDRNTYITIIRRLRARLAPHGVSIGNRNRAGYYLDPFYKGLIRHLTGGGTRCK